MEDKKEILNKIASYKMQIIINKSLFEDDIITRDIYEGTENRLLLKISALNSQLEVVV